MPTHSKNTLYLAQWLESQSWATRVCDPRLPSQPQREPASWQWSAGGGMKNFEGECERKGARTLTDATRLWSITANSGHISILRPATTTHGRLSEHKHAAVDINEV
ncbi:protein of unknown function [Methylocaldum szegediense]|uniref:Uncharacterized protein n=2 Tax=Methylocaldum szegediense TaxID=73780 RepID=A0ABN8WXR7_9GAMM|nr:protein of unknown function [Methylocaldum szegediense]